MANLLPIASLPIAPPSEADDAKPELYVVFTNVSATKWILNAANDLAHDLGARLTLLAAQVVPHPLPLDCPDIGVDFTERMLSELAKQVGADITVKLYLCRDRNETIRDAIRPGSTVVIGSCKGWLPNQDLLLARMIRSDGRHVIVIEPDLSHSTGAS